MHNHSNLESKILKSISYQKKIKTKNHSSLNFNEAYMPLMRMIKMFYIKFKKMNQLVKFCKIIRAIMLKKKKSMEQIKPFKKIISKFLMIVSN